AMAGRQPGLSSISCAWKAAFWLNTGTRFRMRQPRRTQRAESQCLGTAFRLQLQNKAMTLSSIQPLFTPVKMGDVLLPNRIVMAPMTRMRASNTGSVPTDLHVGYYAQRASAGLIIGEGTEISPDAYGWADSSGLWSTEQVQGWRRVTDAVHQKGAFLYAQLWHTGAMSHPDFFAGAL